MSTEQNQDIDSRTGKTINPGKPVEHVDVEDDQSVGHSAEPEDTDKSGDDSDPPPIQPPPRVERDDIYKRAREKRDQTIQNDLSEMDDDQKKHYQRMVVEASGEGEDPFAEETEPESKAQKTVPEDRVAAQEEREGDARARETEPASADPALDPNEETVTITVYGMREEVPRSEVEAAGGKAAYQKNRAADIKLQRLTTYEASLRELDDQLSQRAARSEPQGSRASARSEGTRSEGLSPTDDPDSAADEDIDYEAIAGEVVEGMFSGDEDEAKKRLARSLASIGKRKDAGRVADQTGQPAQQQPVSNPQQQSFDERVEANRVFAEEFPELQTNVLRQATLNMVNEVARDPVMRGRPLAEITREAAGRVSGDIFGDRPPRPAQPSVDPALAQQGQQRAPDRMGQRMQLKERTVVAPLHETGRRHAEPTGDDSEIPSDSEYIVQMRKRRNLPT